MAQLVGRGVASNTDVRIQELAILLIVCAPTINCIEKTKMKKKWPLISVTRKNRQMSIKVAQKSFH